jgi:alpha-ketoglutaric semialdehyde dehydrogenase
MKVESERPEPIPIYAEMSSINPILLLLRTLMVRATAIAEGFISSLVLGARQFCTNPGVILVIDSENLDVFLSAVSSAMINTPAATMTSLNQGITMLFITDANHFLEDMNLHEEVFGPAAIILRCVNVQQMCEIAERLEGTANDNITYGAS